jgi:hypothetical protein
MFFRRRQPAAVTFAGQLDALQRAGFALDHRSGGSVRATRAGCAIDLREADGKARADGPAGILMGAAIASLLDGGYQKFFRTPEGARKPATAAELETLHAFEENLKQCLGEESLYNESLGTVSTVYQYDRLKDRDRGVPKRPWE